MPTYRTPKSVRTNRASNTSVSPVKGRLGSPSKSRSEKLIQGLGMKEATLTLGSGSTTSVRFTISVRSKNGSTGLRRFLRQVPRVMARLPSPVWPAYARARPVGQVARQGPFLPIDPGQELLQGLRIAQTGPGPPNHGRHHKPRITLPFRCRSMLPRRP